MFTNCVSLIEITGLDKWNTGKVTKMNMIFQGCKQLKRLDLSNWDTKSLIDITEDENSSTKNGSLFTSCIALEFIDITGWDTSKIERFVNVFAGCISLKQIKGLDTWNFGNAKELFNLFYSCPLLEELDLSNVNFSQIENLEGFINECGSLNKIVLNNNTDVNIVSNYLPNRSLTTTGSITLKSDKTNIDTTLLLSKNWNLI
jgi:surface protein